MSSITSTKKVKFQKSIAGNDFYAVLKTRVDHYFTKNRLSTNADWKVHSKILLFFTLYFLLIGVIYSNALSGISLILSYTFLGFVTSLICVNFCHDVIHGAYFASPRLTKLLGYVYDINGLSSYMWKITHNLKHHTFTNIPGFDDDIDKAILLRLSPKDDLYAFHKYQQIYAFFLYFLTSLNWAYYADCKTLYEEIQKKNVPLQELILFLLLKSVNLLLFLILPMLLLSAPAWQIFLGFICMHLVGGFMSAVIFQLAHVIENVSFPVPDQEGKIANRWAIHEMHTTSNFATNNPFWAWLIGGLNHQVEHHLFPYICHTHYPKISKIVRETAKEYHVPYHEQPTFTAALKSHFRTLKKFGMK